MVQLYKYLLVPDLCNFSFHFIDFMGLPNTEVLMTHYVPILNKCVASKLFLNLHHVPALPASLLVMCCMYEVCFHSLGCVVNYCSSNHYGAMLLSAFVTAVFCLFQDTFHIKSLIVVYYVVTDICHYFGNLRIDRMLELTSDVPTNGGIACTSNIACAHISQ